MLTLMSSERWASVWSDVRSGVRQLRGSPALSAVLIATLGLGLGLTIAVFSVIHAVLLRPLPYANQDRLVVLFETLRASRTGRASVGHFYDWTAQARVLEATAALQTGSFNLATAGDPEQVSASRVTPGFFTVLHVAPAAGRYFTDADVQRTDHLVVLSHGLWQRRFGADPAIIGREVRLNGEPYTVMAVADAGYSIAGDPQSSAAGLSPDVWTPLTFTPAQRANYGNHAYLVVGKLKAGVDRRTAQDDLERVTRDIARRQPQLMTARSVNVMPLAEMLVGTARTQLYFLLGTVAAVLLIGCVNVTSALVARAAGRRREMAIRAALGGGRLRLARQVAIECLVMAVAGGFLALITGALGTRLLIRFGPAALPRLTQAELSLPVVLFAAAATLVIGMLFAVAPALRAAGVALRDGLADAGRHARLARTDGVRSTLVVVQMALTVVLVVAAGLLIRSAYELELVPLGFDPARMLAGRVTLPADRYQAPEAVAAAYSRILDGVRATPGVDAVGAATIIPLFGGGVDAGVSAEGKSFDKGSEPAAQISIVTDGYVEAQGIAIRRGRSLTASDMLPGATPAVLINERLASLIWPGEDPIGKRLSTWTAQPAVPEWREVVGVTGDTHGRGPGVPVSPELLIPYTQAPDGAWNLFQRSMAIVVRAGEPTPFVEALRHSVHEVDPTVAVFDVGTGEDALRREGRARRLNLILLSMLAVIALGLATVGIYGLIVFFVTERTAEIGLRLALGATTHRVLAMVLRRGMSLTAMGLVGGLAGALSLSRVLRTVLFGVQPTDPSTYAAGACVLGLAALIATAIPAWRAARIDPARSLNAQ
jgi:predicted permease